MNISMKSTTGYKTMSIERHLLTRGIFLAKIKSHKMIQTSMLTS